MEETTSQEISHSRRSYLYDTSKSGNNSKKLFIIVGIIILILAIGGVVFAVNKSNKKEVVTPTPTPTQQPTPTEEPSPTPTISGTPTPTKKVTPTPSKISDSTTIDRSKLTIAIQNGGGVPGAGNKMSAKLKDLGYVVASTGNADSFDYDKTVIQVKSTKKEYLDLLKKDLSSDYTLGTTSATLTSGTADAVVIVGKN